MAAMHALRRGAAALHLALCAAVILGVSVQVYLAGAAIFGASNALDAHRTVGNITHGLEGLVLVCALVAWLPRSVIGLSFALLAVGTLQVGLSDGSDWVGGLHAFGALLVLGLALHLVSRRVRERAAVAVA
jgi:hypothetical protein